MKLAVSRFFTPDRKRILIFAILVLVALAGYVQSWVFSGKDMGTPKPLLFDQLAPFPFWVVWVMLLLPLGMLSNVIVTAAGYNADFIMHGPSWLFWAIQLSYFYTLACAMISVWTKLHKEQEQ